MRPAPTPLDSRRLRVQPLAARKSKSPIEGLLLDPDAPPPPLPEGMAETVRLCARDLRQAREREAAAILMYGAHLLKNGGLLLVNRLIARGWVTHLATNGAGTIHDWELAYLGRTEEGVRENVATGTFGAWEETGRCIHLALLTGALRQEGYGRSLGRFICEDGVVLPSTTELESALRNAPAHPLSPARAELLQTMLVHQLPAGPVVVPHRWRASSILAQAFRSGVPFTAHPGIGYDIITCHPMFCGAAIGRAAAADFRLFCGSVDQLDGGVTLAVGSAIMAPQVFEKSASCVNNLRLQEGRPILGNHQIYVVDIQDGGRWDWSQGEPPKDNPAYYLRFCKSFARMGGTMRYAQCDNVVFLHNLLALLERG